jgi:hypothetical protein
MLKLGASVDLLLRVKTQHHQFDNDICDLEQRHCSNEVGQQGHQRELTQLASL